MNREGARKTRYNLRRISPGGSGRGWEGGFGEDKANDNWANSNEW